MSINALLIGCGNIGGLYDFENKSIQTHAKALSRSNWIDNVDVFDIDIELIKKICRKYNFTGLNKSQKIDYKNYDIVCISTPTDTHYNYLKLCFKYNVPLIVCEKPLSNSIKELNNIKSLYESCESRVIVNYFRRFLSSYSKLKSEIDFETKNLKKIKIKYYKGFLNNCGHAFNIIEYLINSSLKPMQIKILKKNYDFFKNDPTITTEFISNNIEFEIKGLNLKSNTFEINFHFDNQKIIFGNGGDKIEIYENDILTFKSIDLIKDYMIDVYNEIKKTYFNERLNDNFVESINLNKSQILNFL
tara:strand:- start:28969 stop:29877 length:909 start_codon:yes stop_codon:yes gene_type:complete